MGGEQQLLCLLRVLDLNYSLCPWISTLAITPGGLWEHCSTWRALNIFFIIQGQTQRQNSRCTHTKIQNKVSEGALNTFIQSCKLYALFCLVICTVTTRFFSCTRKPVLTHPGWFIPDTLLRKRRGSIPEKNLEQQRAHLCNNLHLQATPRWGIAETIKAHKWWYSPRSLFQLPLLRWTREPPLEEPSKATGIEPFRL